MDSQFNAIDYSHQLQAVGVSQEQAEMHAKLLSQALTNCAASRADLNSLGERLNARMSVFEERIMARMDAFETRITARLDAFEARIGLKLERMAGEQKVLRWMCATNTALMIAVIVKIYFP